MYNWQFFQLWGPKLSHGHLTQTHSTLAQVFFIHRPVSGYFYTFSTTHWWCCGHFVGVNDLAGPTSATGSGEVAQFARAGEGLSGAQPDFDDFFHHRTEEEEDDRIEEEQSLARRDDYPTVSQNMRGADPTTGFRRGEEPLRRDHEFLRQWEERENEQRGGRSFDLENDQPSTASNSREGNNYHRGGGGGMNMHSPMGSGFHVGTQIHVVGWRESTKNLHFCTGNL